MVLSLLVYRLQNQCESESESTKNSDEVWLQLKIVEKEK